MVRCRANERANSIRVHTAKRSDCDWWVLLDWENVAQRFSKITHKKCQHWSDFSPSDAGLCGCEGDGQRVFRERSERRARVWWIFPNWTRSEVNKPQSEQRIWYIFTLVLWKKNTFCEKNLADKQQEEENLLNYLLVGWMENTILLWWWEVSFLLLLFSFSLSLFLLFQFLSSHM
jgi:hypothetical protein